MPVGSSGMLTAACTGDRGTLIGFYWLSISPLSHFLTYFGILGLEGCQGEMMLHVSLDIRQ